MARMKYYDETTGTWKYADEKQYICPVQSVNGMTGAVSVTCQSIGAEPANSVSGHNASGKSHEDIRSAIEALTTGKLDKAGISFKTAVLTMEDGTTVKYDVLVLSEEGSAVTYTNQVPISIDTDGSIYNGVGYINEYRLSSTGALKSQGYSVATGYIPAKGGDTVQIKGCGWATTEHPNNYICAYDSSFTYIGGYVPNTPTHYGTHIVASMERTDDGNAVITLEALDTIAYIRVSSRGLTASSSANGADMIVTINEESP